MLLKNGAEIANENVTDPDKTSLSVGGLDVNTEYNVSVFARNFVFEGPAKNGKVQTKFVGENIVVISYQLRIQLILPPQAQRDSCLKTDIMANGFDIFSGMPLRDLQGEVNNRTTRLNKVI